MSRDFQLILKEKMRGPFLRELVSRDYQKVSVVGIGREFVDLLMCDRVDTLFSVPVTV
jgi:hypothetical protein